MFPWTTFLILTFYKTLIVFAVLPPNPNLKKKYFSGGVTMYGLHLCMLKKTLEFLKKAELSPHLVVIMISGNLGDARMLTGWYHRSFSTFHNNHLEKSPQERQ